MTDREINKVLAEVTGVVTWAPMFTAVPGRLLCQWEDPVVGGHTGIWNPLTDHNQMALVKAGLREKGYVFGSYWWGDEYAAFVGQPSRLHPLEYKWRREAKNKTQELRAFAEAVAQMKGEQL